VKGDADRLTQVLANLLSNAAKFSPRGETVRVSLGRRGDSLQLDVSDRGPGIPEEFRPALFQRFAQADSSDRRKKGGTGLGLSISKAIVE
jgi:signal transduction histidine kinase